MTEGLHLEALTIMPVSQKPGSEVVREEGQVVRLLRSIIYQGRRISQPTKTNT